MTIELSRRQIKTADRVGGVELMMPWPDHLPRPDLPPEHERDPTPDEREWAQAQVIESCRAHDLVPVRVSVSCLHWPLDQRRPMVYQPVIGVVIIGRRWVHAERNVPEPRVMWVER